MPTLVPADDLPGVTNGFTPVPKDDLPRGGSDPIAEIFGSDAPKARRVVQAESSGNPTAQNTNRNGTVDRGLFQINSIHIPQLQKEGIISTETDLFDPVKNTKAALYLKNRDGWKPWDASKAKWDNTEGTIPERQMRLVPADDLPEKEPTIVDAIKDSAKSYLGNAEALGSQATNMVFGLPIGGIAGLAKLITSGDPSAATKTIEEVSRALTYQPQTAAGQRSNEAVGQAFDTVIGKPVRAIADKGAQEAEKRALMLGFTPEEARQEGAVMGTVAEVAGNIGLPAAFGVRAKTVEPTPTLGTFLKKIADPKERIQFVKDLAEEVRVTKRPVEEILVEKVAPIEQKPTPVPIEELPEVKPVVEPVVAEASKVPLPEVIPDHPIWKQVYELPTFDDRMAYLSNEAAKFDSPSAFAAHMGEAKGGKPSQAWIDFFGKESDLTTARKYWTQNHRINRKAVYDADPEFIAEETIPKLTKNIDADIIGIREELYEEGFSKEQVTRIIDGFTKASETQGKLADLGKIKAEIQAEIASVKPISAAPNELPGTPQDFSLSGAQPIKKSGTFTPPEVKGARLFETERQNVDQLYDRLKAPDKGMMSLDAIEAGVKGGKISNQMPKYSEGSSLNLERMDTTNDIKEFQRLMTQKFEEKIGKHTQTWEETRQQATELGWDLNDMIKQRKGKAYTAAEIDAMRQINANARDELFYKFKNRPIDRTPENDLDLLNAVTNYGEVLNTLSSASSEAGRSLNIHKKMIANDPQFIADSRFQKVMKKMLDRNGGTKVTQELIDDFAAVNWDDVKSVNDLVRKYSKVPISDMIYEAWINGLLSAPITHEANIAGNTLAFLSKPLLETPVASIVDAVMHGRNRTYRFGETPAEIYGATRGIVEGARVALKTWKTGVPSDRVMNIETKGHAIPGKAGEVVRTPTRALSAADDFFKTAIYRSEIQRLAYREAARKGGTWSDRLNEMARLVSEPTTEMMAAARKEGLYRTFNQPLGHFGNAIMAMRDTAPGVRYVVPFIKTPTNIFKFALERTPANVGKIVWDAKKGKIPMADVAGELAKPIVGTMIGLATYFLADQGLITGRGPKDKNTRDQLYAKGWQPYSLHVGDTYYGFNRLEPVGTILGMAADFAEAARTKDKSATEKAARLIFSITKNLGSKTFVTSLSGGLDVISDPDRYATDFINRYAGTLIPNVVASAAKAVDDKERDVKTPIDAIQSRIPILREQLPIKRVNGRIMVRDEPALSKFLSPVRISTEK